MNIGDLAAFALFVVLAAYLVVGVVVGLVWPVWFLG